MYSEHQRTILLLPYFSFLKLKVINIIFQLHSVYMISIKWQKDGGRWILKEESIRIFSFSLSLSGLSPSVTSSTIYRELNICSLSVNYITLHYIDGQKNKYSVLNECNRMLKYNTQRTEWWVARKADLEMFVVSYPTWHYLHDDIYLIMYQAYTRRVSQI
jgi:hypothetical protein